jgi:hypothetical protein
MNFIIMAVTCDPRVENGLVIYSFGVPTLPLLWIVVFIGYFAEL